MTVLNPMNKIVRLLKGGETIAHGEQVKRVSPPAKGILDVPKSFFSGRRYGLTFGVETEPISSTLTLRDGLLQRHVVLRLHWYARLTGDGGKLLAKLVVSDDSPQQVVEALIVEWLNQRAAGRGSMQLSHWVYGQSEAIARELPGYLRSFDLDIRCELDRANLQQKGLSLGTFAFDVRTKDSARIVRLTLDMFIDPGAAPRELAPKHAGDWQTMLKKAATEYMERHETLEAYYRDERLVTRLHGHLDSVVAEQGWRVSRFQITTNSLPENTSISGNFDVPWTSIAGENFSFKVKVSLEIARGGIRAFDANDWPDLNVWTQAHLVKCFDKVLFHRDKDKLSPTSFEDIRQALKEELQDTASRYGLTVKMLLPNPDLPQWKYLSDREFAVKAADYQTHDAGQTVNFDMTITGYFSTIGAVFAAEKGGKSLEEQIAAEAIAAAGRQMRLEEPRTYYSAFMPPPAEMQSPPSPPANGYLQSRLVDVVRNALWKKFEFRVSHVHVLRQDPKIRERVKALCNELPREFEVKILPEGLSGADHRMPMQVTLQFLPPPAEYMAQFMSHDLTPEALITQVKGKVEQILNGLPKAKLAARTHEQVVELRALLAAGISNEMLYRGLSVQAENVSWGMSAADIAEYKNTEHRRVALLELDNELFDKKVAHVKNMTEAVHAAQLAAASVDRLQDPRDIEDAQAATREQQKLLERDVAAKLPELPRRPEEGSAA